jgi:hypothetical protein
MRYVRLTILLCGLIWLCCCSTQLLRAEVVTRGYICCLSPYTLYNSAAFELSGVGFDVTGSFENPAGPGWGPGNCVHCLPGTSIPVGGQTGGDDFNGGTAKIGTDPVQSVIWYKGLYPYAGYSEFTVSGPPILLTGPGVFKGTFYLIAPSFLCGFLTQSDMSCDVSLPSLTGSGIVTVDVGSILGSPYLIVNEVDYTFIPEPEACCCLARALSVLPASCVAS